MISDGNDDRMTGWQVDYKQYFLWPWKPPKTNSTSHKGEEVANLQFGFPTTLWVDCLPETYPRGPNMMTWNQWGFFDWHSSNLKHTTRYCVLVSTLHAVFMINSLIKSQPGLLYHIFNRESQPKPSFATIASCVGGTPLKIKMVHLKITLLWKGRKLFERSLRFLGFQPLIVEGEHMFWLKKNGDSEPFVNFEEVSLSSLEALEGEGKPGRFWHLETDGCFFPSFWRKE